LVFGTGSRKVKQVIQSNVLTPRSAKASEARKVLQGSWRDLLARTASMTIKLPIIEMITTKKKINPMEEKMLKTGSAVF